MGRFGASARGLAVAHTAVRRRRDFVSLRFDFYNLMLDDAEPANPVVRRKQAAKSSFLVVTFPPQNTAEFWCVVVVPAGTRMRTGVAAPAFDQPGGGRQVELLQLIPAESFGPPQPLAP